MEGAHELLESKRESDNILCVPTLDIHMNESYYSLGKEASKRWFNQPWVDRLLREADGFEYSWYNANGMWGDDAGNDS